MQEQLLVMGNYRLLGIDTRPKSEVVDTAQYLLLKLDIHYNSVVVSSFSWLFLIKYMYFFVFCCIYQFNQTSFTLFDILSTSLINIPDLVDRINYEKGGK